MDEKKEVRPIWKIQEEVLNAAASVRTAEELDKFAQRLVGWATEAAPHKLDLSFIDWGNPNSWDLASIGLLQAAGIKTDYKPDIDGLLHLKTAGKASYHQLVAERFSEEGNTEALGLYIRYMRLLGSDPVPDIDWDLVRPAIRMALDKAVGGIPST